MSRAGRKHPLIVYQHIVSRWWTPMIAIGLGMFALAYSEYLDPIGRFLPARWMPYVLIGILSILIGIFFLFIRHLAYVQLFPGYLKLVTPFLRLNISYKRIRRTVASEMHQIIPLKSMSGWMQDIYEPLAGRTALVIELSSYPISPFILRLFLSRFFFRYKDKSPHLVLLVPDWLRLSTELDSLRTGQGMIAGAPQKRPPDSILSRLPQKK
ncbi:MAG TPA: hypothetical protein VNK49_13325 [Anaerolineales bacterium]|nr:hypothetical protein [Anaerolineales bacterium]